MKKYKKITYNLYDDDMLIHFLEEEARNGWKLSRIHYFYLEFESIEPAALKYQIDHVECTSEYESVIESLGYKKIKGGQNRNIYVTENLEADDLYNDGDTKIISYLNHYKLSKILTSFLLSLFFFIRFYMSISGLRSIFYRHSLAQFLITPSVYLVIGLTFLIAIYQLFKSIYLIYMRKQFKKLLSCDVNSNKIYKLLFINNYIEFSSIVILIPILFILLLAFFFDDSTINIIFLLIYFCVAILIIQNEFLIKYKFIRIIQLLTIIVFLCLSYASIFSPIHSTNQKLYYENKVNKNLYVEQINDLFVNQRLIHIFHNDYYENHTVSLNNSITEEIFKEEVIRLECYSRGGDNVTADFYHTFDRAVDNMQKLDLPYIDQGYFNDQYVICIKDNEVLSFRIADVDKEEVIQYYFN